MPYELEKSGTRYYVVNKVTGERHSTKPMPKARAVRQMRALYAAESKDTAKEFTVMKQADGRYRWVLFSSNAFRDRVGEIVSQKALEGDVELTDKLGDYGPLRWWHVGGYEFTDAKDYTTYRATPGLDIGDCDFRMVSGKMLIESGTFRDDALAEALEPVASKFQASIYFAHPNVEPDEDGVFTHIKSLERSLLPKGKACNRFTKFLVEKENDDMATLKEKIEAFVGLLKDKDLADSILNQANIVEKEAETLGIASKEIPEAPAPEPPAVPEDLIAGFEAMTTDKAFKASTDPGDYLVVEKGEEGKADTLHLQVKVDGKPDHRLMAGAHAALTSNHRGKPYAGPDKDKALTKLKALYKEEEMDWPEDKPKEKEFSFGDITTALYEALHEAFGNPNGGSPYGVQEVFPGWFIYQNWDTGDMWRDTYAIDEDGCATLGGSPIKVVRHTVYLPDEESISATSLAPIITGMKEIRDMLATSVTLKDDTIAAVKEAQDATTKRIADLEALLSTTQKEIDELKGGAPRGVKELQAARASQSESTKVSDGSKLTPKEADGGLAHIDPAFLNFATTGGNSQ